MASKTFKASPSVQPIIAIMVALLFSSAGSPLLPLPLKRPTRETDWLKDRQAVTHPKATASSDKAAGYWEREQATGTRSRVLENGADYSERKAT